MYSVSKLLAGLRKSTFGWFSGFSLLVRRYDSATCTIRLLLSLYCLPSSFSKQNLIGYYSVFFYYPVIPGSSGICVLGERSEENLAAGSKTSGEDGLLTWENLPITLQYRITETKAPEGFTLLKEVAFEGTLPADTLELRVVNGEAFTLPKTGSVGFVRIPMATVFCLMLCAANLWLLRKKEQ